MYNMIQNVALLKSEVNGLLHVSKALIPGAPRRNASAAIACTPRSGPNSIASSRICTVEACRGYESRLFSMRKPALKATNL